MNTSLVSEVSIFKYIPFTIIIKLEKLDNQKRKVL